MNNKKYILILIIILVFFISKFNLLKKISLIISYPFEKRISTVYGFCQNEGIGYVNFVKKKFVIDKKIRLINSLKRNNNNSGNWAVYDTRFNDENKEGYLILINNNIVNYPIDDRYEIIHNYEDCYLLRIK